MGSRLITNRREPSQHTGAGPGTAHVQFMGRRRAGNVSSGPGEEPQWAFRRARGVSEAKSLAECHLATEGRSLEGCVQETALITH